MTVAELREELAGCPDDMPVLVRGYDAYRGETWIDDAGVDEYSVWAKSFGQPESRQEVLWYTGPTEGVEVKLALVVS